MNLVLLGLGQAAAWRGLIGGRLVSPGPAGSGTLVSIFRNGVPAELPAMFVLQRVPLPGVGEKKPGSSGSWTPRAKPLLYAQSLCSLQHVQYNTVQYGMQS